MPITKNWQSKWYADKKEFGTWLNEDITVRDFITVGVLCRKLKIRDRSGGPVKDNWIYIQEPGVSVGRLQVFNNWSPSMVADPENTWIGLEYFCYEGEKEKL